MDSILIILKKKNGPRASSAPILGLFSITFVYSRSQVSVYRTIGPLVCFVPLYIRLLIKLMHSAKCE